MQYFDSTAVVIAGKVEKVDEDVYYDMLNAVPPERMAYNAFLVGEAADHDVFGTPLYDLYFKAEGYYHAGMHTCADFDSWCVDMPKTKNV